MKILFCRYSRDITQAVNKHMCTGCNSTCPLEGLQLGFCPLGSSQRDFPKSTYMLCMVNKLWIFTVNNWAALNAYSWLQRIVDNRNNKKGCIIYRNQYLNGKDFAKFLKSINNHLVYCTVNLTLATAHPVCLICLLEICFARGMFHPTSLPRPPPFTL